jgi:hypothetical protein
VERNRDHIAKIRLYVSGFQKSEPPVFAWFQGGREPLFPWAPGSDRGTALLLCFCALYQNISPEKLIHFLAFLWREYGTDLFRLNKLPFEDLRKRVRARPELENWALAEKAPGILRSVCDFFFKHGRILPWVQSQADGEATVASLCDEIFMMGKTSAFKSKPRYFLWLLTQLPGTEPSAFWNNRTLLPITPGHIRFLREFGPLKGRRQSPWITPEEKLAYCNRFFRLLAPERPWTVYAALDSYLKPVGFSSAPQFPFPAKQGMPDGGEKKWLCRDILGGCINCPLAPECPGREDF